MEKRIKDIGEEALIARLTEGEEQISGDVIIGPGDDCAVIDPGSDSEWLDLLKTDCVIESVHFVAGTDAEKVGWKAMCRVISDIAGMGGMPQHALVTIAVDPDQKVSELEGWYVGMRKAGAEFGGVDIVGGETASLPASGALISIAMTGQVRRDHYITRSCATAGELIAVTGKLGGSFESGRHLDFRPRLVEANWLVDQFQPSAMMDLSDGLAKDLPRLADASGELGYQVDFGKIPIHSDSDLAGAIGDGEDYELLFTIAAEDEESLLKSWQQRFPDLPLSVVGKMMADKGERTRLDGGWDHFGGDIRAMKEEEQN